MLEYLLWLSLHTGLTDVQKWRLIEYFADPEDVFFARPEELPEEELALFLRKLQEDRSLAKAEKVLADCVRAGLRIVTYKDKEYPKRLKHIPDPPLVLYATGQIPPLDDLPAIGVVGTRKASAYGMNVARQMGWQLAKCGAAVVSGMALGIDAMAMEGALAAGGTVIGVLGCGAEQIYPKANRKLFQDTRRYGCIISEFPPGTPPHSWNFPKRNRIISGLSSGVLVVEAPERSGSLITARQAAEQGRDVFVVPGNVDMPSFAGSYQLLRDGAIPVNSGWELLSEYEAIFPGKLRANQEQMPQPREPKPEIKPAPAEKKPAALEHSDKKDVDKRSNPPYIDVNSILPRLSQDEQAIVRILAHGERQVDDVIAETGLSTGKMLAAMTMLELKGLLRRLPGKRIKLN